ncbi:hypothetical protein OEZ85_007883 [Tetradesmus obliquus]|uniref:Alpha 1,4-glycosyltransferase domain-containing protein n=1 Tax=Tetradesmus obliquus TaxID=3088 RepID=A0ABY8TKX0_TETOB|nr:hypothetical protein OEZ85_007883 [Tetradesmus obliquus]
MNPGYVHRLYDARDRLEFVQQHYPQLLDLFQALPTNVERADFWRYLALHKLGGVYADSDVRCMQPISSWNAEHGHDAALLAGIAKRTLHGYTIEFNQFVMAAMPGHPVMASMPVVIASNFASSFLRGRAVSDQGLFHDAGVLGRTGPGAFTAALRHYNERVGGHWPINSTRADQLGGILFGTVRAMPKFVLGMGWETIDFSMTCDQVKQQVRPEAYICHQFFGTWKKQPEVATNLTYSGCAPGMERVHAEVMPVGNNAREPLPMLVHNGNKYVISEPGTEWGLRVVIENAKQDQRYRVWVKLDGKCIGYTKAPLCESSTRCCSVTFEGFAHTDPYSGNIAYRAFKFGSLKPAPQQCSILTRSKQAG